MTKIEKRIEVKQTTGEQRIPLQKDLFEPTRLGEIVINMGVPETLVDILGDIRAELRAIHAGEDTDDSNELKGLGVKLLHPNAPLTETIGIGVPYLAHRLGRLKKAARLSRIRFRRKRN